MESRWTDLMIIIDLPRPHCWLHPPCWTHFRSWCLWSFACCLGGRRISGCGRFAGFSATHSSLPSRHRLAIFFHRRRRRRAHFFGRGLFGGRRERCRQWLGEPSSHSPDPRLLSQLALICQFCSIIECSNSNFLSKNLLTYWQTSF